MSDLSRLFHCHVLRCQDLNLSGFMRCCWILVISATSASCLTQIFKAHMMHRYTATVFLRQGRKRILEFDNYAGILISNTHGWLSALCLCSCISPTLISRALYYHSFAFLYLILRTSFAKAEKRGFWTKIAIDANLSGMKQTVLTCDWAPSAPITSFAFNISPFCSSNLAKGIPDAPVWSL